MHTHCMKRILVCLASLDVHLQGRREGHHVLLRDHDGVALAPYTRLRDIPSQTHDGVVYHWLSAEVTTGTGTNEHDAMSDAFLDSVAAAHGAELEDTVLDGNADIGPPSSVGVTTPSATSEEDRMPCSPSSSVPLNFASQSPPPTMPPPNATMHIPGPANNGSVDDSAIPDQWVLTQPPFQPPGLSWGWGLT